MLTITIFKPRMGDMLIENKDGIVTKPLFGATC